MAIEKSVTGKDEKIWIKIPDKGTYICNLANGSISPTPARLAKYIENSFDFFGFFIDSKNLLWINNNKYGLICYDIKADKIVVPENKFFFDKTEWVISFFEDKRGIVWFGTRNGLFFWNEAAKTAVGVQNVNVKLKKENLAMGVQGITEDQFNCIWYSTGFSTQKNACIGKYDYVKNTVDIIFNETRDKGMLPRTTDFSDIAVAASNKIFVSDNNNGLLWFSAAQSNPVLKKAADNSALNTNEVSSVVTDNNNKIWCNTNFGIALYNTNAGTFTNYSCTNYAIGQKMKPAIYLSQQSGELYIGQSNAINHINTNLVKEKLNSSDLVFTEIKLFNKHYETSNKTIADGEELIFTHNQNTISAEFALLSYVNAADNLYSWKLEGLEKDWNISENNVATYYQLSPGSYTLVVKAADNNGVWSAKTIKLHIIIKPPFYATWWFTLLSIASIIAAVYYFVQQKIRRIKEKYQLRNKIASDLHDEIGSTLTSISILSDVSQQAMEHRPIQAKEMLQQIASQSKTIQQNMSDIVWSIRPDNEKIENLVVRMREFAAQTLEPLNINTSITADDAIVNKILPMQYRKDILLIYKEAINNITKHANATTAKILLTGQKGKMVLSIADNGTWKNGYTGTGTKTMQERATAIGGRLLITNTGPGTQILLTLPLT
jgi:signal transduction histidine kinase